MKTLSERLEAARVAAGVSQADIARAAGVSTASVSDWFSGATKSLKTKSAMATARFLGVSLDWLTTGQGPMALSSTAAPTLLSPADDNIGIPLLDVRASAGLGEQQPDHDPMLGTLRLSIPWMQRHLRTITSPGNLACLFAYGPSMQPTFADGSILIVDVGVREVKVDAIYVLQRNDELYVKRLQRRLDGTMLMISDNPHYPPETLTPDGKYSMQVLGRVVWAFDSKGV